MRQAGRALPEYRALKEKHSFLELVQTPELATEVTLQPIRRFGFDAAVLFSDILVLAEALGQGYHFREQGGIAMEFTLETAADVARLETGAVRQRLDYVARALPLIKQELAGRTALLGFCGAPWTMANFMVEGGSSREFTRARALFYTDRPLFNALMEKLAVATTDYLLMQIEAGADAVQIFDTLAGLLPPEHYEAASGQWIRRIVAGLGGRVPVILFAKGMNTNFEALLSTGAPALGIDWAISLGELARRLPANVAVQGNLDPVLLTTTPAVVAAETTRLLTAMRGRPGHIFNLGHGVTPQARLENIESLVNTVRNSS